MRLPSFNTLSALLLASEVALALSKRSKSRAATQDRSTLPILWIVIFLSIGAGLFLRETFPQGALPEPLIFYLTGLVLFFLGLVIRWVAIIYLGRFFTVNVAIAEDHQLITTGPYRYVRHPSYTGTLLVFLGFGLCMLNFYSLVTVFLPIAVAFLWRMHVEESALQAAFGERYREYRARTARLIPHLF